MRARARPRDLPAVSKKIMGWERGKCSKCDRPHQARGLCKKHYEQWRYKVYPDRCKAACRRWYARNRDLAILRAKKSLRKNRARVYARISKWRKENREIVALWGRKWRKANPSKVAEIKHRRRAQINQTRFSCKAAIEQLFKERYCRWCRSRLNRKNFSIDHIIPLSRGGQHKPNNLAAACKKCNSSKGTKLLSEWLPTLEAR